MSGEENTTLASTGLGAELEVSETAALLKDWRGRFPNAFARPDEHGAQHWPTDVFVIKNENSVSPYRLHNLALWTTPDGVFNLAAETTGGVRVELEDDLILRSIDMGKLATIAHGLIESGSLDAEDSFGGDLPVTSGGLENLHFDALRLPVVDNTATRDEIEGILAFSQKALTTRRRRT